MSNVLVRLWKDQTGAIVSAELMLVATILVIGVIVGLKSIRDSVVTELADVAQAFANVDQTYSYSAVVGHDSFSGGSLFWDRSDFCDERHGGHRTQQSKCVNVAAGHGGESSGGHHGGWGW